MCYLLSPTFNVLTAPRVICVRLLQIASLLCVIPAVSVRDLVASAPMPYATLALFDLLLRVFVEAPGLRAASKLQDFVMPDLLSEFHCRSFPTRHAQCGPNPARD